VHLIDEENSGYQLSNALVNVAVDYFVDLASQFLCHLGLLRFHDLTHETHEIVASLRTGIGHIQIVKGDILNNLFFLVNISLRKRHILFSLQIELAGIRVASADSLDVSSGCFDVDDVSD
jgi:hypothetical protein